jgi:drug/metabolite transporter (DMT)-like permease
MLGASLSFVLMQAAVKYGRARGLDTSEVMFFRTAPGLPLLFWLLRRQGHGLMPSRPLDVAARSALGTLAMSTNFVSMLWLSLAQFSTLGLSQPVFVALLAPLLLGEPPRVHVFVAMALASAGAYVLIAPGLEAGELALGPTLLGLSSAVFSAFAHVWVRKATAHEPPERVVFHFAALVALGSLATGLTRGHFTDLPHALGSSALGLAVLGMAFFGTLGQVLMTRAYLHGDAASVSMVGYASVGFAMLADIAVFDVFPATTALIGAFLMIVSGVILVRGTHRAAMDDALEESRTH